MEIERKFRLIHTPADIKRNASVSIRQGYLYLDDGVELRIREKGDKYFMTCKDGEGLIRREWEVEIPFWVFSVLWIGTRFARIEKRRYSLTGPNGLVFEVDIFLGSLRGLVILEVEFPNKDFADGFELPEEFTGIEVTEDERYKNRQLAISGIPD